jgi:hypothetical protein
VPSRLLCRIVIATLARRKRQVTPKVHLIVQDSADFDDPTFDGAVYEEVTSSPAVAHNMKRADARHNFVSRS